MSVSNTSPLPSDESRLLVRTLFCQVRQHLLQQKETKLHTPHRASGGATTLLQTYVASVRFGEKNETHLLGQRRSSRQTEGAAPLRRWFIQGDLMRSFILHCLNAAAAPPGLLHPRPRKQMETQRCSWTPARLTISNRASMARHVSRQPHA